MMCSTYRLFTQLSLAGVLCALLALQAHASPLTTSRRAISDEVGAAWAAFKNSKRDSVSPPIIKPDASSVWPIGSTQEVTWDTSGLPANDSQITNRLGRVLLGRDTGDSLNLDIDNPLAEGFSIRLGKISVTVPNVPPRSDYLIVLMGNSGNTSPSFAITQIAGGNNAGTPPVDEEEAPSPPAIAPETASTTPVAPTTTTITDPIPISGTTITGSWDTALPESASADSSSSAGDAQDSSDNSSESALDAEGSAAAGRRASVGLLLGCVTGGFVLLGF